MKICKVIYTLITLFIFSAVLYAQCSDAGICVIGKNKPELSSKKSHNKLSVNYNLGFSGKEGGDFIVNTLSFGADLQIFNSSMFNIIIPITTVSGPIVTEKGFGDMIVTYTTYFHFRKLGLLGATVGAKIETGSADLDGLQQAYQPGLGTNDLLLGVGSNSGPVNIYLGYQLPFGRSPNGLTRLKRGQDIMLRFGYTQPYKLITLQAEVIAIKRLQRSSVLVPKSDPEQFTTVDGSNEFQANLLGRITFQSSKDIRLEAYVAVPLLKRTYNLDGLKRVFSFSASFNYLFDVDF